MWPSVNCLYEQLLQAKHVAKKAVEKAKVTLRKAKQKLYEAMSEYQDVMDCKCSHGSHFILCGKIRCVAHNYVFYCTPYNYTKTY